MLIGLPGLSIREIQNISKSLQNDIRVLIIPTCGILSIDMYALIHAEKTLDLNVFDNKTLVLTETAYNFLYQLNDEERYIFNLIEDEYRQIFDYLFFIKNDKYNFKEKEFSKFDLQDIFLEIVNESI